jgi:hypothetical protein
MKFWLITICMIFYGQFILAQDPLHWEFSAKKTGEGQYELHLKATVQEPWHTYSQTTPDGGPLPTKIVFTKNPLIKTAGTIKEVGELKTIHDEAFGVDVKYFSGNVDFVQVVTLRQGKVKTNLTGTVEYMVCDDHQCLPPKTVPFSIPLQ